MLRSPLVPATLLSARIPAGSVRTTAIRNILRERILDGRLADGDKLPPSQGLAALWNTDPKTIQRALAPLVREGLLSRAPRRGTFVRRRGGALEQIGIYLNGQVILGQSDYQYLHQVYHFLRVDLAEAGIDVQLFVDHRSREVSQQEPFAPLTRAVDQRQVQGLVAIGIDCLSHRWLRRLPVPAAFHVSANGPGVVRLKGAQLHRLALQSLRDQGCRSVGLLTAHWAGDDLPRPHLAHDYFDSFHAIAAELGLSVCADWMIRPAQSGNASSDWDRFAYHAIRQRVSRVGQVDGLVIDPDHLVPPAVLALVECGVKVPGDLALAIHVNRHVPVLCPLPAARIVTDEAEVAAALIRQVRRQVNGDPADTVTIGYTTVAATATDFEEPTAGPVAISPAGKDLIDATN